MRRRTAAALIGMLVLACRGSLSPLSNRLQVGKEPYLVLAGDGEDHQGDLFASPAGGGVMFQVTFTRVDERLPALSPDGTMLAFIRSVPGSAGGSLVVMNLLNGAERRGVLSGPAPDALAWARDGSRVFVRSDDVRWTAVPPGEMVFAGVSVAERPTVDSLFRTLLGDPPIGEAVACDSAGLCVRMGDGTQQPLTAMGRFPRAWSGDSIVYQSGEEWVVRPLGGGRVRRLAWTRPAAHLREVTVFGGR